MYFNFHTIISCLLIVLVFTLFITQPTKAQPPYYFPPTNGSNTWEKVTINELGWCQAELDTLVAFLDTTNTKAFIVLKNGRIAIEKYFGTFTADSNWYWASAGKSMTAFLIGIAQQQNSININNTSATYLGNGWTSCPAAKEAIITVKNQISMTTGLDDGVPDKDCTDPSCLQYLADAGTRWAYHNAPYTLLDAVIANATGLTLNQFFIANVRNPIGMNGAYFKLGYNNVLFTTPRSMARFGLLVLNKGSWNDTPILADSIYFHNMVNTSQNLNLSYGYLWWLNGKASFMLPGLQYVFDGPLNPHAPNDAFAALGKNGQIIYVVPSQDLVLIRMGNNPDNSLVPATYSNDIWQYFSQVVCPLQCGNQSNVVISGSEVVCNHLSGNTYIYSVAPVNGSIYIWTVTGGTIISGQGTSQITVSWGQNSTGSISVVQETP
ncbi:MAG: serine hydrolase [Sphingobacteriales bacterium]|nr:serine hydrolase [Sphingobacteriales bacterium]